MKKKFLPLLVVGLVTSFLFVFGRYVYAEESPPSVTLCVKNSGAVFMIGQGFKKKECLRNDKAISLNLSGTGAQGPIGPQGEQGIQGETGPQGIQGEPGLDGINGQDGVDGTDGSDGVSGWEKVVTDEVPTNGTRLSVTATCPSSKKVIGGGYVTSNAVVYNNYYTHNNYPSSDNSWTATIYRANGPEAEWKLKVYAICISAI